LGFELRVSGSEVSGFGFRGPNSGFQVDRLAFRVSGFWLGPAASCISLSSPPSPALSPLGRSSVSRSGFSCRVLGFEFRALGFSLSLPSSSKHASPLGRSLQKVSGFGFRVSGSRSAPAHLIALQVTFPLGYPPMSRSSARGMAQLVRYYRGWERVMWLVFLPQGKSSRTTYGDAKSSRPTESVLSSTTLSCGREGSWQIVPKHFCRHSDRPAPQIGLVQYSLTWTLLRRGYPPTGRSSARRMAQLVHHIANGKGKHRSWRGGP